MSEIILDTTTGINPVIPPQVSLLKKRTVKRVTQKLSDKKYPQPKTISDPRNDFIGKNGKMYRITYPNVTANCLAFALHFVLSAKNSGWYVPGWLSGKWPQNWEELTEYFIQDLTLLNRNVHKIIVGKDIPTELPKAKRGTYWIKCVSSTADNISGMHFMCKDNSSERWIHKPNWYELPKVVVYNDVEIRDNVALLMKKPEFANLPFQTVQEIACSMGMEKTLFIKKNKYEDDDSASYFSIRENDVIEFKPIWAMLIDE